MSSWLSLGRRSPGEDGGADEAKQSGEAAGGNAAPSMDPEEVRRRRLERLQAQAAAAAAAAQEEKEKEAASSSSQEGGGASSMALSPPPSSPAPTSTPTPTTTTTKMDLSASASASASSSTTPPKPTINRNDLATHRLIQRVFQVTADSNETNGGQYVYLPDAAAPPAGGAESGGPLLFNITSISELICARLSLQAGSVGGVSTLPQHTGVLYLAACYGRYEGEARSRPPYVTEESLKEMREQLVNFSVTCVMEPEVFGLSSEEIRGQFYRGLISMAESPMSSSLPLPFLKCLLDGIDDAEIPRIFAPVLSELVAPLIQMTRLDQPGASAHVTALQLLVSQHKAIVDALINGVANFTLPPGGVPLRTTMMGPMTMQRNGRAHEGFTTLGVCFRLGYSEFDREVVGQFENLQRRTRADVEGKMNGLRAQLVAHQNTLAELLKAMLKAGGAMRVKTVGWLCESLALNMEAEKSRANEALKSSNVFLINLAAVLLRLSGPFIGEGKKRAGIDVGFVGDKVGNGGAYPSEDVVWLKPPSSDGGSTPTPTPMDTAPTDYSFITQCFFLTFRALHLGLVKCMDKRLSANRYLGHLQSQMNSGVEGAEEQFNRLLQSVYVTDIQLQEPDLLEKALTFVVGASGWFCQAAFNQDTSEAELTTFANRCPEYLVEDLLDIVIFISRTHPKSLAAVPLADFFTFCIAVLAKPMCVASPHLRAQFGDVLYLVFLPPEDRLEDRGGGGDRSHMVYTNLLLNSREAQQSLAPSLLLLYGDVEHTGHYEKLEHRFHIAAVLKYLWKSSEHRSTFRRISTDTQQFTSFANGLMNETNRLVADVLEKLPEIRSVQMQQKDLQAWGALPDTQREEILSRHRDNERHVTSSLLLMNETIHMVMYLTSDETIRRPFLAPTLCGRLANMLLSIISKLVGTKGLEIKVENPDALNFKPKEMLHEGSRTILHFAKDPEFHAAMAESGYYTDEILGKMQATMRKLGLMSEEELSVCASLEDVVKKAWKGREEFEEVPDEYLDQLLYEIMKDPVRLPSGEVMDRAAIEQHLLNQKENPFNRQPLSVGELVECVELKEEIERWKEEQRGKKRAAKAAAAAGGGKMEG